MKSVLRILESEILYKIVKFHKQKHIYAADCTSKIKKVSFLITTFNKTAVIKVIH